MSSEPAVETVRLAIEQETCAGAAYDRTLAAALAAVSAEDLERSPAAARDLLQLVGARLDWNIPIATQLLALIASALPDLCEELSPIVFCMSVSLFSLFLSSLATLLFTLCGILSLAPLFYFLHFAPFSAPAKPTNRRRERRSYRCASLDSPCRQSLDSLPSCWLTSWYRAQSRSQLSCLGKLPGKHFPPS